MAATEMGAVAVPSWGIADGDSSIPGTRRKRKRDIDHLEVGNDLKVRKTWRLKRKLAAAQRMHGCKLVGLWRS
jgi:hypothetical protein